MRPSALPASGHRHDTALIRHPSEVEVAGANPLEAFASWHMVDEASFREITYDPPDRDLERGTPSDHCPIAVGLDLGGARGVRSRAATSSSEHGWAIPRCLGVSARYGQNWWRFATDACWPGFARSKAGTASPSLRQIGIIPHQYLQRSCEGLHKRSGDPSL
jgi:hypothetical protein